MSRPSLTTDYQRLTGNLGCQCACVELYSIQVYLVRLRSGFRCGVRAPVEASADHKMHPSVQMVSFEITPCFVYAHTHPVAPLLDLCRVCVCVFLCVCQWFCFRYACVCVCVCVCERKRESVCVRERNREKERDGERCGVGALGRAV